MVDNEDLRTATLDNTQVFDKFDLDFAIQLLGRMGYPSELIRAQMALYENVQRHPKVARSYGEVLKPTAGLAQRCSLPLIAANALLTVQFNRLDERARGVRKSAFVDDRTLDTENPGNCARPLRK